MSDAEDAVLRRDPITEEPVTIVIDLADYGQAHDFQRLFGAAHFKSDGYLARLLRERPGAAALTFRNAHKAHSSIRYALQELETQRGFKTPNNATFDFSRMALTFDPPVERSPARPSWHANYAMFFRPET